MKQPMHDQPTQQGEPTPAPLHAVYDALAALLVSAMLDKQKAADQSSSSHAA